MFFGKYLSSISLLVICFDLYCISKFQLVSEKVNNYYNTTSSLVTNIMDKYVPKYKEKKLIK